MANDSNPPGLPVGEIIVSALSYVWVARAQLLAMAMLPAIGLSLLKPLTEWLMPGIIMNVDEASGTITLHPRYLVLALASCLFYVIFAVAWHRKWLLGDENVTIATALRWDGRKFRFLLKLIAVTLTSLSAAVVLSSLVLGMIGAGGTTAAFSLTVVMMIAVLALVFGRFALVLPAAAVDHSMGFGAAWAASRGNSWQMAMIVLLPQIPVFVLQYLVMVFLALVAEAVTGGVGLTASLLIALVGEGISFAGIAVSVSALSMSFRYLTGFTPGRRDLTTEDPEA